MFKANAQLAVGAAGIVAFFYCPTVAGRAEVAARFDVTTPPTLLVRGAAKGGVGFHVIRLSGKEFEILDLVV